MIYGKESVLHTDTYVKILMMYVERKIVLLCDALALSSGFCLLEKRMLDVVMRYNFNEFTLEKRKVTFDIQRYFEKRIGKPIYSVLHNIKETTLVF